MDKAEIDSAIQAIYDSYIVQYGLPRETMVTGIRTEVNAFLKSINYNLEIGTTYDLTTLINMLAVFNLDLER